MEFVLQEPQNPQDLGPHFGTQLSQLSSGQLLDIHNFLIFHFTFMCSEITPYTVQVQ